jgi:hypothetical protein
MAEILRQYPNNRLPVILSAMDEWRFGRAWNIRRCWVPQWTRAVVWKQYVREYEYMYTAVFPWIDKQDSLILPYVNTECMQKFIDYVSEQHPYNLIVMQIDNAWWHTTWLLNIPNNMIVIWQPPYTPEVNPTELIRREGRRKFFSNNVMDSMEFVRENLVKYCSYMDSTPWFIASLCWFPHLMNSLYNTSSLFTI